MPLPPATVPTIDLEGVGAVPVRNIYCIGRNYAEHAAELNNPVPSEPVVFLKSTAALRPIAAGPLAFEGETFHHEAELVLLVGRDVALGAPADWQAVAGVGLGLDLTRREVQTRLKEKGLPWTIAKSFAGSAMVTPFVAPTRLSALDAVRFHLKVNGELKQQGDTRELLFKVPTILSYLARLAPLMPGDLVYTGTPKGVGPLRRADRVELGFAEPPLSWQGLV